MITIPYTQVLHATLGTLLSIALVVLKADFITLESCLLYSVSSALDSKQIGTDHARSGL